MARFSSRRIRPRSPKVRPAVAIALVFALVAVAPATFVGVSDGVGDGTAFLAVAAVILAVVFGTDFMHARAVRREREEESICTFAKEYDLAEIDARIVRAVHEHYAAAFPIRSTDIVRASGDESGDARADALAVDDDEFEDELIELARSCGRRLDDAAASELARRVRTVDDVVRLLARQPLVDDAR